LKIKPKGCHFDTLIVIEGVSQAMMSILTEHDFQDEFKNGRTPGRGLLRGSWWPVGSKLIFEQMAAPVSKIIYRVITKEMTEIKHVLLSHGVT
jgi:hypothetical protein